MSLGAVSRFISTELAREAQVHGVQVWLDLDGHYGELAQALRTEHAEGRFAHPVLPFEGSYLELMLALEPHAGGLHPEGLVIHLPGFNEQRVAQSPLLELYRAGRRFRIALDTAIRQAASGLVTPAELEVFLAGDPPTLAQADAWLAEAAGKVRSALGAWLAQVPPVLVVQALEDARHPQYEALQQGLTGAEVRGYFERRLGVDAAWRAFAGRLAGRRPAAVAEGDLPVLAHALAVEFVDDLRRAPTTEALVPLARLSRELTEDNTAIAKWLRQDQPDRYERIADELEGLLESEDFAPKDLGEIDTFRFEEVTLMAAALEALDEDRFTEALAWAAGRKETQSFWANRATPRRHAWRLIAAAARLGQALERAETGLNHPWHSQGAAVDHYTAGEGAWQVDRAHRVLEQERALLWSSRLPHYPRLQKLLGELRESYRIWADALAARYADHCAQRGLRGDASLQQRTLFIQQVRPLLTDHPRQRTAYVLVDALRYELGEALYQRLGQLKGMDVQLGARLAECPTITAVGMNALADAALPDGRLRVIPTKNGRPKGLHRGEYAIDDPASRRRAMRDGAGLDACLGLTLAEVLEETPERLEHRVRQVRLVVVHAIEVDEAGEHGHGLHVFDRVLQQLDSAVRLLREAGVHHFVITADHGFLLTDDETREKGDFGGKRDPTRRYALHEVPQQASPDLVHFSPLQLGLDGLSHTVHFRRDTHVFQRGKTKDGFVHGGISLQERVIPVLRLEQRRQAGGATLTYALTAERGPTRAELHRLRGTLSVQATGMLAFGGDASLILGLRVREEGARVELVDATGAERRGGTVLARVGQPFEVLFRLRGPQGARVQVELYDPGARGRLEPVMVPGFFDVQPEAGAVEVVAPASDDWLEAFDAAGVRQVFAHLAAHGAITEAEATAMLGGPRKFRRFARRFDEYVELAPFTVHVESAASGKRYVRDGSL